MHTAAYRCAPSSLRYRSRPRLCLRSVGGSPYCGALHMGLKPQWWPSTGSRVSALPLLGDVALHLHRHILTTCLLWELLLRPMFRGKGFWQHLRAWGPHLNLQRALFLHLIGHSLVCHSMWVTSFMSVCFSCSANNQRRERFAPSLLTFLSRGLFPVMRPASFGGTFQWLFSACAGNAARYASPLLRQSQGEGIAQLSTEDRLVLECLRHMVRTARPRVMDASCTAPPFLTIYTDASFEEGELRLGWVIFPPSSGEAVAGTCLVPDKVVSEWKPRQQHIFPGETLAALIIPILYPDLVKNMDALWFIDNQAAVSAAITGSSKEGDIHEIAHYAAVLRINIAFRVFFEWVDSDSNPSDG